MIVSSRSLSNKSRKFTYLHQYHASTININGTVLLKAGSDDKKKKARFENTWKLFFSLARPANTSDTEQTRFDWANNSSFVSLSSECQAGNLETFSFRIENVIWVVDPIYFYSEFGRCLKCFIFSFASHDQSAFMLRNIYDQSAFMLQYIFVSTVERFKNHHKCLMRSIELEFIRNICNRNFRKSSEKHLNIKSENKLFSERENDFYFSPQTETIWCILRSQDSSVQMQSETSHNSLRFQ